MKKILFLIIWFYLITQTSYAFFWDTNEDVNQNRFYSKIYNQVDELENQFLKIELNWSKDWKWILAELNEYASINYLPSCLDNSKTISIDNFQKILEEENIALLSEFLVENCVAEEIKEKEKLKIEQEANQKIKEMEEKYSKQIDDLQETEEYKNIESKVLEAYKKWWIEESQKIRENSNIHKQILDLYGKEIDENDAIQKEMRDKINSIDTNKWSEEWNWYTIELLRSYFELFKKYNTDKTELANLKTDQSYKISNIWLYADWDLENSEFDLIDDIEQIDEIIFASVEPYEWEENLDLWWTLNSILDDIDKEMNNIKYMDDFWNDDEEDIINNSNNSYYIIQRNNIDNILNNSYVCSEELNNSWLDDSALSILFNNIDNSNNNSENKIIIDEEKNISQTNINNSNWDNNDLLKWNYEKVRDNSEWPCEDIFCINIDFIMYNHNLFWWWENITIEYLLNRSNEHFKKFAATSLIPADMSVNLFELSLESLNLPDIFHIWIQVTTKPIPILNIEATDSEDESEYAAKNLLERYYSSRWLDYERRNDLILLKWLEQEKQTIINNKELTTNSSNQTIDDYNDYLNNKKKEIEIIKKSVEKKVSYWVMRNFETQFDEISNFTKAIDSYIQNIDTIIKNMNKINSD